MKDPEIDPLAPDLRALLAVEKAHSAPSADGKARVAARLESMLAGPGGPGGSGGSGGGGRGVEGGGADVAPRAPAVVPPFGGLARVVGVFVAGAITGGVLVFALREPRVQIVERVAPSTTTSASATEATTAYAPVATRVAATDDAEADASVAASDHEDAGTSQPKPTDSLAAERALLDPARTALGRGDGASALDAVHKHEARFANGKLAEEREAIAVQALVVLHRSDEARARAARFQQRYPGSVLAPSVAAALETAP
jgi:hypothetical protein